MTPKTFGQLLYLASARWTPSDYVSFLVLVCKMVPPSVVDRARSQLGTHIATVGPLLDAIEGALRSVAAADDALGDDLLAAGVQQAEDHANRGREA